MDIRRPYLLFLGDAPDQLAAKTAYGVAQWRREVCVGQLRLDGCRATCGLPDLTLEEAAAKGAQTLIIGVANRGGRISDAWQDTMLRALELGMDIASGLHNRIADLPAVAERAKALGRSLFDVRHPDRDFEVATGAPRGGRRLLTVGTDCSVGKMFTSLALEREMRARGLKADFRATGQTGILIAGGGVSVDAVVADFISGATEWLAPEAEPDHWDLIEGQGSLFHASYAGVSLGLLHGAQAEALVMCHEPGRPHMRGLPHFPLPDLAECIALNERCARLTNPDARVVGLAFNTSALDPQAAERALKEAEDRFGLPAVDPVRTGVGAIVDRLVAPSADQ
ncbi:N-acetyltransferase DgcN [Inquilinus limosus]|uniref:N-acetyltransferase DgcN n=1 Tax=Inquilinus limosus TaxID=171674 RepID=UPI000401FB6E|nr:N-acetyltransferase DgcN [Inquilinus limosus]